MYYVWPVCCCTVGLWQTAVSPDPCFWLRKSTVMRISSRDVTVWPLFRDNSLSRIGIVKFPPKSVKDVLLLLLLLYRISQFSALAGKYSPILGFSNQQDWARWSYLWFRKFLTIEHVSRITDFCICIYVFGCKLSLFRLCGSDFGITSVDDITIGITFAAYYYYRYECLLSQIFSSWYFSWTSGDPHRSGFKFHTAVLSVLCVIFQV